MSYTEQDLGRLLAEVRRPFQTTRDIQLDHWRNIRHRREMPWLPDNMEVFGKNNPMLTYRDPLPEFTINRIKQRLGVNEINIAVSPRGEVGPVGQRQAEKIEDWFRGAHEELDPLGLVDAAVREGQAGDGGGCFELEFLPRFTPPSRGSRDDQKYDSLVDRSRREYGLPVCLNAPDLRSLYWDRSRNRKKLFAKVVDVPLIQVRDSWTAEGFKLAYKGDAQGVITQDYFSAGELPPSPTVAEYGRLVRFVLLTDDEYIYHCIYPTSVASGAAFPDEGLGAVPNLLLLAKYPNPIHRPPFFLAPSRMTNDADPGYEYLPLAWEILETAPYVNQIRTIQLIKAMIDALKPIHARRANPGAQNKVPPNVSMLRPGFIEFDGTFSDIPTPQVPDLDKMGEVLTSSYNAYQQTIQGAVESGAIGRSTPAWSVSIQLEEMTGLLSESLNNRANAWREVLLAVGQCVREKYVQDGPIYVSASRRAKQVEVGRQDMSVGITEDDLASQFRLSISIEAMTQSQRAANTEYGRKLYVEDHAISRETYINEYTPVTDRLAEDARLDREALMIPMKERARSVADAIAYMRLRKVHGDIVDIAWAKAGPPLQPAAKQGDDANVLDQLVMPGQGMSIEQPGLPQRNNGGAPVDLAVGESG